MKFITSVALFVSAAAASAIPRDAPSPSFTLKTSGSSNGDHNGLYLYAYHTGAGLNDAVLSPDAGTASTALINGTQLQFPLGSFQGHAALAGNDNYGGMFIH